MLKWKMLRISLSLGHVLYNRPRGLRPLRPCIAVPRRSIRKQARAMWRPTDTGLADSQHVSNWNPGPTSRLTEPHIQTLAGGGKYQILPWIRKGSSGCQRTAQKLQGSYRDLHTQSINQVWNVHFGAPRWHCSTEMRSLGERCWTPSFESGGEGYP